MTIIPLQASEGESLARDFMLKTRRRKVGRFGGKWGDGSYIGIKRGCEFEEVLR